MHLLQQDMETPAGKAHNGNGVDALLNGQHLPPTEPQPSDSQDAYDPMWPLDMPYSLSNSDAEPLKLAELVSLMEGDTARLWAEANFRYSHGPGEEHLLQEAARVCDVSPSDLQVCPPQMGIYITVKVIMNRCLRARPSERPHAIVTHPGHWSFFDNLHEENFELSHWNPKPAASEWIFDVDDFKSLLRENTRFVLLNFPHNPTGYDLPADQWRALLAVCKERDIFVVCDEIHRLTAYDGSPGACVSSVSEEVITIGGLSKTFGLAGLRVGWVCCRNPSLLEEILHYVKVLLIGVPQICQILGTTALRNEKHLLQRTLGIIEKNLSLARDFFIKHEELFIWREPCAGTIAMVEMTPLALKRLGGSARIFCERLRDECDFRLFPTELFKDTEQQKHYPDRYVRVGLGRRVFPESLLVLEEYLHRQGIACPAGIEST